jgi:hypothetical protein
MKPHYKLNIDGTRLHMPPFIDDDYEFSPEFMERQFLNAYRRLSDGTKNSFSSMFAVAAGLLVVFKNPLSETEKKRKAEALAALSISVPATKRLKVKK